MADTFLIDSTKLMYHPRRAAATLAAQQGWEDAKWNFPLYVEVSPSGKCNHRCLTGDTPVNTIYGPIPIKTLAEQHDCLPVYTYQDRDVFIANAYRIRLIERKVPVVRVQFDDESHIDCTPDHEFLRIVGKQEVRTQAQHLVVQASVRALREDRTGGSRGYTTLHWGRQGKRMRSRMIMDYLLGRKLTRSEFVHPINHDTQDDYPSNLLYVSSAKGHSALHPEVSTRMRENNPTKNMTDEWRKNISQAGRGKTRSLEQRLRYRASKLGPLNPRYKAGSSKHRSRIAEVNHKIVSVTPLTKLQDVYCLEVPSTGWFFANNVLVKNCTFCAIDYTGYRGPNLDPVIWHDRTIEMGHRGVKSVMFAGEGEPLLNPSINQMVDSARQGGIDVAFTTNGILLDRLENLDRVSWIKVSVNAGSAETYSKVHRTPEPEWAKLWGAIGRASQRKGRCALGVQMVVLPENEHEMERLRETAREHGADYVVFKPYSQHKQSLNRYEERELPNVSTAGGELDTILRDAVSPPTYTKCLATPQLWAYIMSTGDVYTCSAYLLDRRFWIGNINQQSFTEVWTGDDRRRNWELVTQKLDISECRHGCRMDKANRYLTACTEGVPHGSFI